MDGVIARWDDPPNPERLFGLGHDSGSGYNAGNIYNCRCYAEVVVNLDYVDFPIKVYRNNTIARMTRADFEKIS
jgi:uncharacterized protein with gpF-like domain